MREEELKEIGTRLFEQVKADPENWMAHLERATRERELTKRERGYLLLTAMEAWAMARPPRVEKVGG